MKHSKSYADVHVYRIVTRAHVCGVRSMGAWKGLQHIWMNNDHCGGDVVK